MEGEMALDTIFTCIPEAGAISISRPISIK